jgi:hypothetical protein
MSMRKTHVSDSPTTGHQYHNRQITHHFFVGWSTGLSAGRKNMLQFFPGVEHSVLAQNPLKNFFKA